MDRLRALVFRFFATEGTPALEIHPEIWQVKPSQQVGQALLGRANGFYQFTFDPDLAESYGAELLSLGSQALGHLLDVISQRGKKVQAYLPHAVFDRTQIEKKLLTRLRQQEPTSRWYILNNEEHFGPYLLVVFRLTFLASDPYETLKKVLVNLRTGEVRNFPIPSDLLQPGRADPHMSLEPRLNHQQAYAVAQAAIISDLKRAKAHWAQTTSAALQKEAARVKEYYAQGNLENESSNDELATRLAELEAARPTVKAATMRVAELAMPKFHYRLMQVAAKETPVKVDYEPIGNSLAILEQ